MKKYLFLTAFLGTINCYANPIDIHNMHSLMIVDEKDMPFFDEHKEEINAKKIEIKKNGYYFTNMTDDYVSFLKNIKKNAPQEIRSFKESTDTEDSHLKGSANEIKLAFRFKKLPIDDKNIIGYAPIGTYKKSPEGWNGIKIFFDNPETRNVCAYEFTDMEISHGGVALNKDKTAYTINKKPTLTGIEGNQNIGFEYSVIWYNNLKVSRIDCINNTYDKSIIDKMTQLAIKIDNNGLVAAY